MKRSGALKRKTPLKRTPFKRRRKASNEIPNSSRAAVVKRSGGLCEAKLEDVCTGWGEEMHHPLLRSRGGNPDTRHAPESLLHACIPCHRWIHANPKLSTALGLMRHAWDEAS